MQKSELLSQLKNAKNNFILGLAACSLFANEETYPILDESSCRFGVHRIEFSQVADMFRDERDRDLALKEFTKMVLRAIVKEGFQLVKDYCRDSGQLSVLKTQPWYQYARIIRNCLSHNFRLEFNSYDRGLLPVSWRDHTLTAEMNGSHLELSEFGWVESWELFADMRDFARDKLT